MGTWNSFTLYQHLTHNCCGGLQSFWAHFNLLSASAEPYYKQFAEWRRNKSSARHIRTLAHTRYNPPSIHCGSLLLWSTEVDGDDCYANSSYSTKKCAEIPSRWCVYWGGIRKGGEETSTSVATFSCLSPYPKVLIVPKGSLFAIIINEEEFARGFQEERETTTEKWNCNNL